MNDFTVLHLSDLHIDNTDGHLSVLLKNLLEDIKVELEKSKHVVIVVTGDIVHQGNYRSGIDKVTKEKYEQNLEEKLENLVERMKTGSYCPNPTRRVYIPKETKGKMRPLGISSYEDKLVESAIA